MLSIVATGVIGVFAHFSARENASALLYESAVSHLEVVLRGLSEAALTERSLPSLALVNKHLGEFRALRSASAELAADTGERWPDLRRKIEELLRDKGNIAFGDDALIALGGVTGGVERVMASLGTRAMAARQSAAAGERHIQIANVASGALFLLATVGLLILRDITARTVLDAVRASEAQLRDITDAMPAMIAYVDAEGRFRFHNKAYERTLGLRPEQIEGVSMREVLGAESYERLSVKVDEVLAGSPVNFEHATKDGLGASRDYGVHFFPRRRGGREDQPVIGFYSIVTDITETKRIDRMKTEFISTVSHELRTPLTSIRGSLGLLTGGVAGSLPEAAKKLVEIAKNNCERLIRLINDILDTEKIESGQMRLDLKVVELPALVAQTLAANEGFAGQHGIGFALRAPDGSMRVNVDADRLVQAITNLLSNAVKFSPARGTVEVIVSREAGRVRLEVRDQGSGIPEEFRSRIFQKFSQADSSDSRPKGGSGLGLNITKAIIEKLDGTIGFTTEAGAGTRFFFELPEWRAMPAIVTTPTAGGPQRPRILVCEDDADIGRLIGMMLDNAGYDADFAFTAAQARQSAAARPYAAMTVDLNLPDQDGIALIRALRDEALTRDLPMVVVAASPDGGRVQINSETLSVSAWLGKPIDENRLILAIRRAVESATGNRPPAAVQHAATSKSASAPSPPGASIAKAA